MESFKELNDVVSKNDGSKSRLVFQILIDRRLFIEFIESNEEITRHDKKNQQDKKWVTRTNSWNSSQRV